MEELKLTVKEFKERFDLRLQTISNESGVSMAMISKLTNNQIDLSKDIKEKLEAAFPGIIFIPSTESATDRASRWKDKYEQEVETNKQLKKDYDLLEEACNELEKKLFKILLIITKETQYGK